MMSTDSIRLLNSLFMTTTKEEMSEAFHLRANDFVEAKWKITYSHATHKYFINRYQDGKCEYLRKDGTIHPTCGPDGWYCDYTEVGKALSLLDKSDVIDGRSRPCSQVQGHITSQETTTQDG